MDPAREAFRRTWPEASTFNILDDSLSEAVPARPTHAGHHGAGSCAGAVRCVGAIGRRRNRRNPLHRLGISRGDRGGPGRDCNSPSLGPTEAAFDQAIGGGGRIVLLVTFEPSLRPLLAEAAELAANVSVPAAELEGRYVDGALRSLQAGDTLEHDRLIVEAVSRHGSGATVVFGQFSMARARASSIRIGRQPCSPLPIARCSDCARCSSGRLPVRFTAVPRRPARVTGNRRPTRRGSPASGETDLRIPDLLGHGQAGQIGRPQGSRRRRASCSTSTTM